MPSTSAKPTDLRAPSGPTAGVVIITGASSGIGRCTAGLFARHGWRVGLIARGKAGLHAARGDVERQGAIAATAQADVTNPIALEAAAAYLEQALGPMDVWVNCAGNGTYGRFLDTPANEFQQVTEVTYMGTVNGTRIALQRMVPRDRGRIVNVCSAVAYRGMPLLSSYSGAKQAVRGFGQSICAELSQEGSRVRLTTIFPPAINTPFFDHAISHMARAGRPIPPVYQPEIVAQAIHLATIAGRREMPLSFTTVLFSFSAALVPSLVDQAIRRLGYNGQLVDPTHPTTQRETTLFAPSDKASPVRGGFDSDARSNSMHLRMLRTLAWLTGKTRHHVSAAAVAHTPGATAAAGALGTASATGAPGAAAAACTPSAALAAGSRTQGKPRPSWPTVAVRAGIDLPDLPTRDDKV